MTNTWMPLCLAPECDVKLNSLDFPIALIGDDMLVRLGGSTIDLSKYLHRIILVVGITENGEKLITGIEKILKSRGLGLPGLRLTADSAEHVNKLFFDKALLCLGEFQYKIYRQQREIAEMRRMIEDTLLNFERLESYVWQVGKGERQLTHHYDNLKGETLLVDRLTEQRLPGDSVGLSDIAIWIANDAKGTLNIKLFLGESSVQMAAWEVTNPSTGWLRLGLVRALSSDAQTPFIQLDFSGTHLRVGCGLNHPDIRFQCRGGPMLALKVWKFISGVSSPMVLGSQGPKIDHKRWLVGKSKMRDAIKPQSKMEFVDWADAVAFYPEDGQTLELRIPCVLHPEIAHVQAVFTLESTDTTSEVALTSPGDPPSWQPLQAGSSNHVHYFPHNKSGNEELIVMVRSNGVRGSIYLDRIEAFSHTS